jgi:hypothetical protein
MSAPRDTNRRPKQHLEDTEMGGSGASDRKAPGRDGQKITLSTAPSSAIFLKSGAPAPSGSDIARLTAALADAEKASDAATEKYQAAVTKGRASDATLKRLRDDSLAAASKVAYAEADLAKARKRTKAKK